MNLPSTPHAAPRGEAPDASGESYSNWVREVMRAVAGEPGASVLFDSTIREPTELLASVARRAFEGGVTDRFESVFAGGNPFVVQAVAARYGVARESVICTTGATSAMAMAIRAYVAPGDHVIVESPCFDLLPGLAKEAGATISYLPRRAPSFDVDLAELEQLIRPDTKLVLLTHLHNPSGAMLGEAALAALGELATRTGVPILIDEVYGDFAGPGSAAAALSPDIISVGSLAKAQGLFALKCGWAIASPARVQQMLAANSHGDLDLSKLSHAVAALVLEDMAPFDEHWRATLEATRPVAERHIEAMVTDGLLEGGIPLVGCMCFPGVVGVSDTRALAAWLWREHRIVVAPGEFFGLAGHIRIGFGGAVDQLDRGLARLHGALAQYRR
ncbi:MAG: pyridoxal phosphate-dependent aminotransferase [Pseudomonadota bacterium]